MAANPNGLDVPQAVEVEQPKPTAIIRAPQRQPVRLGGMLSSLDEAWRMAQHMAKSDLVPKDYKGKPENCLIAIQWGAELGITPMASLKGIAVINGRPSVWGDIALAMVMGHPEYVDHEETWTGEGDTRKASVTFIRKGKEPLTREFSVADAKKAKLWGKEGPWTNYPDRMLQMRARGFAIRDRFPDALNGMHLAEEVQDLMPIIDAPLLEAEDAQGDVKREIHNLLVNVLRFDSGNKRWNDARVTAHLAGKSAEELAVILEQTKTQITHQEAQVHEDRPHCPMCAKYKRMCDDCLAKEKAGKAPEPQPFPDQPTGATLFPKG